MMKISAQRHRELDRLNRVEKRRQFLELKRQNDLFDRMSATTKTNNNNNSNNVVGQLNTSDTKLGNKIIGDKNNNYSNSNKKKSQLAEELNENFKATDDFNADGPDKKKLTSLELLPTKTTTTTSSSPALLRVGHSSDDVDNGIRNKSPLLPEHCPIKAKAKETDESEDDDKMAKTNKQQQVALETSNKNHDVADCVKGKAIRLNSNNYHDSNSNNNVSSNNMITKNEFTNEQLMKFVSNFVPKNKRVLCLIVRDKLTKFNKPKSYICPTYYLFIQAILDIDEITGELLYSINGLAMADTYRDDDDDDYDAPIATSTAPTAAAAAVNDIDIVNIVDGDDDDEDYDDDDDDDDDNYNGQEEHDGDNDHDQGDIMKLYLLNKMKMKMNKKKKKRNNLIIKDRLNVAEDNNSIENSFSACSSLSADMLCIGTEETSGQQQVSPSLTTNNSTRLVERVPNKHSANSYSDNNQMEQDDTEVEEEDDDQVDDLRKLSTINGSNLLPPSTQAPNDSSRLAFSNKNNYTTPDNQHQQMSGLDKQQQQNNLLLYNKADETFNNENKETTTTRQLMNKPLSIGCNNDDVYQEGDKEEEEEEEERKTSLITSSTSMNNCSENFLFDNDKNPFTGTFGILLAGRRRKKTKT